MAKGYGRRSWLLELASPTWPQPRSFQFRCSDPGKPSLGLEVELLRWLAAREYPISPPVLWVGEAGIMGEPFALLGCVSGATLATGFPGGGRAA